MRVDVSLIKIAKFNFKKFFTASLRGIECVFDEKEGITNSHKRSCSDEKQTVDGEKCPSGTSYISDESKCCCFPEED
jgi:hypothetical protein